MFFSSMGYHTSMIAPEHHPLGEIWTCPTGGRHEIIFSTFCQFIKNKIKNGRFCGCVRQNKTKKSYTVGKLDVVNVLSQPCEATVYSEFYVARHYFTLTMLLPQPFMLWVSYTVISDLFHIQV